MARRNRDDDLLLEEDELTAAFLGDETAISNDQGQVSPAAEAEDEWDEDENVPGQLAVDVYETKEKLVVKARTAGVNKNDLDVSISDNQLTVRGTLSSGSEEGVENYFLQECYWGEFSRTIALPVPVKEEEIEAVQKTLELSDEQCAQSKKILFECGNMSSATLPHIWAEILADQPPRGQQVCSLAFGPGLTLFGALFEVV